MRMAAAGMIAGTVGCADARPRRITSAACGHILTNVNCWSPDSKWIVYDVRSDAEGATFDGVKIERVDVETGAVDLLYESKNGACCGVVTYSPTDDRVAFIAGPENPTPDWKYAGWHRQGVGVDVPTKHAWDIDALDLTPPFTPGALRGGTHVHVFSPDGKWVSFTYEDALLAPNKTETADTEINIRNVGVCVPGAVTVMKDHPRNRDGGMFSVLVTRTVANPEPGSDQIKRAFEDGWIGRDGYTRADGSKQRRAISFQGTVVSETGTDVNEVFVVDLPDDLTKPGAGPLAGTETTRPRPPAGVTQRRLTRTTKREFPGLQGPRQWMRGSPDGSRIACLMKDDAGVVQIFLVSTVDGALRQLTHNTHGIASAFTWTPDGLHIAHVMDGSVCLTDAGTGETRRLTQKADPPPRPEACVVSPDGRSVAFVRQTGGFNQICVVPTTR